MFLPPPHHRHKHNHIYNNTRITIATRVQAGSQSVILKLYLGILNANIPLCCSNIIYKECIGQNAVTPVTDFYLALFKPGREPAEKCKAT